MRALAGEPWEAVYAVERTGCSLMQDTRVIKAVDDTGRTRGMVVYGGWAENSVQVHMAVDTPLAWRALLPGVFTYPFLEAGRGILLGTIRSDNRKALILVRHLGFEVIHRVRHGMAVGVDMVLVEMRRENCPWLDKSRRQQRPWQAAIEAIRAGRPPAGEEASRG